MIFREYQAESYGADPNDIRGVFHGGRIYLVRQNLHSVQEAEKVLFHEGYGHYGLRALYGQDLARELRKLFMAIGGARGFNEIAKANNIDLKKYAVGLDSLPRDTKIQVMMDELLAHIAEQNKPSIKRAVQELMGRFRQWLRRNGFLKTADLSNSELLLLLSNARAAMEGRGESLYRDNDDIRFMSKGENNEQSRSSEPGSGRRQREASEEFGRNLAGKPAPDWHLQTRIRGKHGRPVRVFRGSEAGLSIGNFGRDQIGKATNHPSAALGVWFTTSNSDASRYGSTVDSVYLDIRKPKVYKTEDVPSFDSQEAAKQFADRLRAKGYDGIIFDYRDIGGPLHVMAFEASQVYQSNQKNKGTDAPLFSITPDRDSSVLDKFGLNPKQEAKLRESLDRAVTKENEKSVWSLFKHRTYEGMFDGLIGIKRAEDSAGVSNPEDSGYVGARLATGVADVMHAILHYGAPQWRAGALQYKEGTKGLLEILGKAGENLNDFLAWVGAHRAEELMEQGRENNLTREDIAALKNRASGKEALFREMHSEYKKLNSAMLDMAEQAGLINADARQKWQSDWYIPFYRQEEGDDGNIALLAPRTKRGLSHQNAGIKSLRGGDMATNDLLENILTNWMKLTDASMKNSALLKTVDNLQDSDYLEAFEGESSVDYVGKKSDKNVVRVQRDGKDEYYKVYDPALLRAVTHLSSSGFNDPVTKVGRYMKRLLTTGITSSPDFIIRNFIRDAAHAWAINPDGFKLGTDSIKGLRDAFKEDPEYRELMFAGASFQGGYVHGTDPEASAQIIRRALDKKGLSGRQADEYVNSLLRTPDQVYGAIKKGWQVYREVGDRVENANRLATYKAAKRSGKSLLQAAFESKDLMDYSLRGNFQLMNYLIDLVPFMNARLQGISKLARAAKEHPRRVLMNAGFKLAMFSFALAMLNDDDERYHELPDWDKDANWHFWLGDDHYRIPKPFEIGIIFGTVPERIYHVMAGNQDSEKLMWSISHNLWETMAINPTPQFAMPIIESVANRQFFFDKPIEGMVDEGKLPEARYDEHTSMTMRVLGEWTGMSPKKLEHLFNGYLGTMGMYALGAADMLANTMTGRAESPDWKLEDLPVIKALYRGKTNKSTQYTTDVYDRWNEVDQLYRTITAFRKEGRFEEAQELTKSNFEKLRYRKALGKARQRLGDIRKQMDLVRRNRIMSAEAKRKKLDQLTELRNEISGMYAELTEDDF
ncbi:LPD38 domain-containing protein [Hahella ganghwensis]|uniref:LPD38 domain-containing protein n=1 Tax=Hahella ganghwensis TaxID=286420 RepID=UPI00036655E4|nr:LPD38 domain-containing protein [Hahella ganghwensis]